MMVDLECGICKQEKSYPQCRNPLCPCYERPAMPPRLAAYDALARRAKDQVGQFPSAYTESTWGDAAYVRDLAALAPAEDDNAQ